VRAREAQTEAIVTTATAVQQSTRLQYASRALSVAVWHIVRRQGVQAREAEAQTEAQTEATVTAATAATAVQPSTRLQYAFRALSVAVWHIVRRQGVRAREAEAQTSTETETEIETLRNVSKALYGYKRLSGLR
jgi:hypothetical protein